MNIHGTSPQTCQVQIAMNEQSIDCGEQTLRKFWNYVSKSRIGVIEPVTKQGHIHSPQSRTGGQERNSEKKMFTFVLIADGQPD